MIMKIQINLIMIIKKIKIIKIYNKIVYKIKNKKIKKIKRKKYHLALMRINQKIINKMKIF